MADTSAVEHGSRPVSLAAGEQIGTYRVAELVTVTRDGAPVGWPMAPEYQDGRLVFSTGYVFPAKARNAQRDPRVAVLYSDPTASGRSEADPLVLVQGRAVVLDQDLQANCDRYVDFLTRKSPIGALFRVPGLRQLAVGYVTRIYIEVTPEREYRWAREDPAPESFVAARPAAIAPGQPIELPAAVLGWVARYPRPPVLSFVDATGWPAAIRVGATLGRDRVRLERGVRAEEGAPVALTFHQLTGNYRSNDAFMIRGHLDSKGALVPERVVGWTGTADDRGVGTLKSLRMLFVDWRRDLGERLAREGRPAPRVRPPAQSFERSP